MNDIPLVKDNGINAINTSLIAAKKSLQLIYSILDNVNKTFKDINKEIDAIDAKFADYLLKDDVVNSITDGDMRPVTSNAVANNTIQKINISVQEADLEANIKAFLDEMSSKPTNTYSGILNSSISNGNYSLTNFYNENTNYRSTIGIIEFNSNYGVYYVFRTSIGSYTPYYIVRRIDMPTISAQNTATIVPSRFDSTYTAWCWWWRCGRMVTAYIYASGVKCRISANEPCFTGLPKPIINSLPLNATTWGGTVNNWSMSINNNGEVIVQGGSSITDVIVHGLTSITYITRDD